MRLPKDHPQRVELNDEVHARPSEALAAPQRISYLALLSGWAERERERQRVAELAERFGALPPREGANHFRADLGPFRLKWERHTEFTRYSFIVAGAWADPFAEPAIAVVPREWLEGLGGQTIVAAHAALVVGDATPIEPDTIGRRLFEGNVLVGSGVGGGVATALTDFRIHEDGFSRLLLVDRGMTPWQAGRMVQRLLEIETYRILALLALPVARELAPAMTGFERELAQVTTALAGAAADEPALLDRLTRLDAEIERRASENHYRFSAAAAYYELVRQRIGELREERIQGLQTFREFNERRLAPAMSTCRAVAVRQDGLSERVARATQLLATRVDITRERQSRALLESMNRRAKLQIHLQQTVEGLSVAAITYYLVSLLGYAAKALEGRGLPVEPTVAMGLSIPVVAVLVWLGVRRITRRVRRGAD